MSVAQLIAIALVTLGPPPPKVHIAAPIAHSTKTMHAAARSRHARLTRKRRLRARSYVRAQIPPPKSAPAPEPFTIPVSDAGLVGYWRGDGCPCDLTKQNPGRATGGVSYAPAMAGNGFRFNGRDDSIQIADTPTLALTGSLTLTAWINVEAYPSAAEGVGMIIFRGDDRAGLDPYTLGVGSDHHVGFHIESTKGAANISSLIPNRRFVMVSATLDASTGKMRLYENAILVAETETTARPLGNLDPTEHPAIGIGNCNAIPESRFRYPFHGIINDMRVYARALPAAEIHTLYADSLRVPSPPLPSGNGSTP